MNRIKELKKRIQRIICDRRGFTLTELLIATLIMVIATASLTSAMMLAYRHFYTTTQRTEAQFLCASLAEFVEDELTYSVAKIDAGTDKLTSWSKGTHNMGKDINFYVDPDEGGGYVKIDEGTSNKYGRIVITGSNFTGDYYKIVSDGAYDVADGKGYSLSAGMSLDWDKDEKCYVVNIEVVDKSEGTVLSDDEFTVKPVLEPK